LKVGGCQLESIEIRSTSPEIKRMPVLAAEAGEKSEAVPVKRLVLDDPMSRVPSTPEVPNVTFRLIRETGEIMEEHKLTLEELTP
jgi:hypothetical protein